MNWRKALLAAVVGSVFWLPAWAVPVTLRVVDQHAAEIPGSEIVVDGIGTYDTGSVVEIPVGTREFVIVPGLGPMAGSYDLLRRIDQAEITAATTSLDFEWITATLSIHIVDQHYVEIPKSLVGITDILDFVETPYTITLPVNIEPIFDPMMIGGLYVFGYPAQMAPGINGYGASTSILYREQYLYVAPSNPCFYLVWPTSTLTMDVVDQNGLHIPGSAVSVEGAWSGLQPTPVTFTVPITDETFFWDPWRVHGDAVVGHRVWMAPGRNGHPGDLSLLARDERMEVAESTPSSVAGEWIVGEGQVQVVDASAAVVAGSTFAIEGTTYSTGDLLGLPLTDDLAYPTISGSFAGGYSVFVNPADVPGSGTFPFELLAGKVFEPQFVTIEGLPYGLRLTFPSVEAPPNFSIASDDLSSTVVMGSASHTDPARTLHYRWLEGGTDLTGWHLVESGGACPLDLGTVPPLPLGVHTLRLEGTDGLQNVADTTLLLVDSLPAITDGCTGGALGPAHAGPGVLCEDFDRDRDGSGSFEWTRSFPGACPEDPLLGMPDRGDDILGHAAGGGPVPLGVDGRYCLIDARYPEALETCHVVPSENDWHLHSPYEECDPTYDPAGIFSGTGRCGPKPRAHSGYRSLHLGRHLNATGTLFDTYRFRQTSAFVMDPIGIGTGSTLEFWHIIQVCDDKCAGTGASGTTAGGQVHLSLRDEATGTFDRWQRLHAMENAYNSVDQNVIVICEFDPGDDMLPPDDETMCAGNPGSPQWSDIGDVYGNDVTCLTDTDDNDPVDQDCGETDNRTVDPGCSWVADPDCASFLENGSVGYGVWARSQFDLSSYAGRRARLRWIFQGGGGWSFGQSRSWLEPVTGSPTFVYDQDDGWYIDDIRVTDVREAGRDLCPATTPEGSDVLVQPFDQTTGTAPVSLTFDLVTAAGISSLATSSTGPAPPAGLQIGDPSTYYEVTTTAAYAGSIEICIDYTGVAFTDEAGLDIFRFENEAWVAVTTSVDTANDVVCGSVASLSLFALFHPENARPVADAGPDLAWACADPGGTAVALNGSGSFDPDGHALTYTWTGPFPEGDGVVTGVSPVVTMPPGLSVVTLVVNDGRVDSMPDTVVMTAEVLVEGFETPLAALVPEGEVPPLPDFTTRIGSTRPLRLGLYCGEAALGDADVAGPEIVALAREGVPVDLRYIDLNAGQSDDAGLVFRSLAGGTWIFRLNTRRLWPGTWEITIRMPDGRRWVGALVLIR